MGFSGKKCLKWQGCIVFCGLAIFLLIASMGYTLYNKPESKNIPRVDSSSDKKENIATDRPKADVQEKIDDGSLKILKSDVGTQVKFYPYKIGDVNMEIAAVRASDGTVRTVFNTCQICYDSGRGYFKQNGEYLVCQNCGNRFHINQLEKVKGGCNPVPITAEDKKEVGDYIVISGDFLSAGKDYFTNWKAR